MVRHAFSLRFVVPCVIFCLVSVQSAPHRLTKRQNGEVIESIFQVPIQTLSAVSNVFKTSIQAVQRQRENFVMATSGSYNRPGSSSLYGYVPQRPPRPFSSTSSASSSSFGSSALSSAYASLNRPRYQSQAAKVAGVPVAADGSSFRI